MTLPHEATRRALDGCRKRAALAIDRSPELVDRWCNAAETEGGSGTPSPAQRVVEMTRVALLDSAADPYAMVRWINTELGFIPPVRVVPTTGVKVVDVARATKEFSDYLSAVSARLEDGHLSPSDAAVIAREIEEYLGVGAAQLLALRAITDAEEARVTRERIGPKRASRFIELRKLAGGVA